METNLEQLKKNFTKIKEIRNKITIIFNTLETHMKKLKETHSNFIKTNKDNIFIFGLDSLQFQSKIIDIECDDMKRLFLAINNRIYCEYYKLCKLLVDYVKNNINEKKAMDLIRLTSNFPVYKDLEPYKQYNFDIIQDIHEHIIMILYAVNEYIVNKQNELLDYKKQQDIGLNINNFVTTFKYGINSMREKFELFISYIEFFHSLHTKYLKRFAMKMNLLFTQITNDIRFEDAPTTSETKKNEIIHTFQEEHIDNHLMDQLTKTIQGTTDSEDSNDSLTSTSSTPTRQRSGSELKDMFKRNVKKMMNGMKAFGPKYFTHIDNNKTNPELPKTLTLNELKDVKTQSPKLTQRKHVSLNSMINPLSEEDTNELNETLNMFPMFGELNKDCDELLSPTKQNSLELKLKELDTLNTNFNYNNFSSVINELNELNEINKINQSNQIMDELLSNISTNTLSEIQTEVQSEIQTEVQSEAQIEAQSDKKKKKKKKKNKK